MTLEEFKTSYLTLANFRGYSKFNPIIFTLYDDGKDFIMVHSEHEPRTAQLPKNVLWLNPLSKEIKRRTDYQPFGGFDFSWEDIVDYADVFSEEPFYEIVPDELRDLGFSSANIIPPASTAKTGLTKLLEPHADSVVVPDEDPRLSDKRYPTEHEHDDFPRTLIRLNDSLVVKIDQAYHPKPNDVLFIKSVSPDPSILLGEWRKPRFDEISWNVPRLQSLRIYHADSVIPQDNSKFNLICDATWEDRTEVEADFLEWSIEENPYGITIDKDSGLVDCPNLSQDVSLNVKVRKQDPFYKHWVEATFPITFQDLYDMPTGLTILGVNTMFENSSESYIYRLDFESGASTIINNVRSEKTNLQSSTLKAGKLDVPLVDSDSIVTLSVEVNYDGQVYSATHDVSVIKNKVETLSFLIDGVVTNAKDFEELSEHSFQSFQATYTNGDIRILQYESVQQMQLSDLSIGTLVDNRIKFANITGGDKTARLVVSYLERNESVTAELAATVLDTLPLIQNLRLEGKDEFGPSAYTLYPRWGTQTSALSIPIEAVFELDGEEKRSFDGTDLNPSITWSLEDPNAKHILTEPELTPTTVYLTEADAHDQTYQLKVKVKVFFAELNLTLEAEKLITYLTLASLNGPIPFSSPTNRLDTVTVDQDGKATVHIHNLSLVAVKNGLENIQDLTGLNWLDDGVIYMSSSPSNTNVYYNYTTLQYTSSSHTLEVFKGKRGYYWSISVVISGVTVGETVELTIEDPASGLKLSRNYTAV